MGSIPISWVGLFRQKTKQNQSRFFGMVPRRGLEPPRLAALVPETSASTNSATWARCSGRVRPGTRGTDKGGPFALSIEAVFSAGRPQTLAVFGGDRTRPRALSHDPAGP